VGDGALGWLKAETLDDDARKRLRAHLRERRPVGVVGQGERQLEFYARLTVSSAGAFVWPGHEPWGVLESAEHGAVIVSPEVVAAAELPALPPSLHRLAARVGPSNQRLSRAKEATDERPAVQRLRERFIAAAVAHAELHRRLEEWAPRG
jgi:hypothetical protein